MYSDYEFLGTNTFFIRNNLNFIYVVHIGMYMKEILSFVTIVKDL